MYATQPTHDPQITRSSPSAQPRRGRRELVGGTLRALNIVGGVAVAGFAFVCVGLLAAVMGCTGQETTGLCVHSGWLVPVLEWPIFVVSVLAPLAGGIAAYVTRRPRWLATGTLAAALMFALMLAVSTGQSGLLG